MSNIQVSIWSSFSFEDFYAEYHIMKDRIKAYLDAGFDVKLVQKAFHHGETLPASLKNISRLRTSEVEFKQPQKSSFVSRYIAEITYYIRSAKLISKDANVVFVQSSFASWVPVCLAKLLRKNAKVILNVQDIFPQNAFYAGNIKSKKSLIYKLSATVQKYGYNKSDMVITISEDMRETLIEEGIPSEKIKIIYNWSYQDEPYENIDLKPINHIYNSNCFNVAYAGNIGVMQNVDLIVETAKILKGYQSVWFHIIGDGVYKQRLEQKVIEYGIRNISFWPMQPSQYAPAIYSAADLNVIPLAKDVYKTALPSKTATCLACNKPIVFAIGKESIFGQRVEKYDGCWLIDSDDSNSLSDIILQIAKRKKTNKATLSALEFYSNSFGKTENSKKYASAIMEVMSHR